MVMIVFAATFGAVALVTQGDPTPLVGGGTAVVLFGPMWLWSLRGDR